MQLHEQEVTLKLNSRPLRLIYLVRNREDLLNAVTLYTHIWGGAANAIFPMPENEEEVATLKCALESINPDYILTPTEGIPSGVIQVLEQLPVNYRSVSTRDVEWHINEQHISGYNLIRLGTGTLATGVNHARLSHLASILQRLYPTPLPDSIIRIIEPGSSFDFELALQSGFPTQTYHNFLREHLGASVLPSPQTPEQLVKYSLLMAGTPRYKNPASLTLREVNPLPLEVPQFWNVDEKLFHLFLSDGEDIGLASAFWNSRCFSYWHNKLFLPKEAFLSNFENHVALILEVMPSIEILFITTSLDEDSARALGHELKNALAAIGRDIPVQVTYGNFRFNFLKGATSWGQSETMTQSVTSDGSIRFSPPVPLRHENTDFVFGYDAEVTFASGRKFFMPATKSGAVLLSYQLERIEYAETHQDPKEIEYLTGNSPVRAGFKGITGTALAGKECRVYIPTGETVIERQIKDANFEIRPNKHTRYAQGFINRFGGFEKAMHLVDKGGLKIISVLRHPQAKEGGLNLQQTVQFLKKSGMSQEEANDLLKQHLPLLLASRLVRRGYPLSCPHCDLTNWYAIENLGEFIECEGCVQNFQLSLKPPEFAYKPNELAARFVEEGGQAVLMTAALLDQVAPSAFIKFGGDILRPGEKRPFAEVDLFWLTGDAFIIAECKSYNKIEQQDIERIPLWQLSLFMWAVESEFYSLIRYLSSKAVYSQDILKIKESLEKTLDVAALISAQVVILGVVTNSSELADLFTIVADAAQKSKERRIGVHLALNGKLYLWGREEVAELWKIQLEHLQVLETHQEPKQSVTVGQMPQQRRGLSGKLFNDEVLQRWEQEL